MRGLLVRGQLSNIAAGSTSHSPDCSVGSTALPPHGPGSCHQDKAVGQPLVLLWSLDVRDGERCCPLPASVTRTSPLGSRPVGMDQPAPAWRTGVTLTRRRGLHVQPGANIRMRAFRRHVPPLSSLCSCQGDRIQPLHHSGLTLVNSLTSQPCCWHPQHPALMNAKRHAAPGLPLTPFPPLLAEKLCGASGVRFSCCHRLARRPLLDPRDVPGLSTRWALWGGSTFLPRSISNTRRGKEPTQGHSVLTG